MVPLGFFTSLCVDLFTIFLGRAGEEAMCCCLPSARKKKTNLQNLTRTLRVVQDRIHTPYTTVAQEYPCCSQCPFNTVIVLTYMVLATPTYAVSCAQIIARPGHTYLCQLISRPGHTHLCSFLCANDLMAIQVTQKKYAQASKPQCPRQTRTDSQCYIFFFIKPPSTHLPGAGA